MDEAKQGIYMYTGVFKGAELKNGLSFDYSFILFQAGLFVRSKLNPGNRSGLNCQNCMSLSAPGQIPS